MSAGLLLYCRTLEGEVPVELPPTAKLGDLLDAVDGRWIGIDYQGRRCYDRDEDLADLGLCSEVRVDMVWQGKPQWDAARLKGAALSADDRVLTIRNSSAAAFGVAGSGDKLRFRRDDTQLNFWIGFADADANLLEREHHHLLDNLGDKWIALWNSTGTYTTTAGSGEGHGWPASVVCGMEIDRKEDCVVMSVDGEEVGRQPAMLQGKKPFAVAPALFAINAVGTTVTFTD
eukprot:TRINITY_DN6248_c0_g1_i6.p1 TRINITY_DN6248_c0_g1~~TRINITY_DN6248_c0_g1_i6.p1  ORF type:complete len:250 (+),score=79.65 TRINITY_DN6248_c0_g1_i6:59-751(+)